MKEEAENEHAAGAGAMRELPAVGYNDKLAPLSRQLAPFDKTATDMHHILPVHKTTVHGYVVDVRNKKLAYRGDLLHLALKVDDIFFLVLSSEYEENEECLIVREITANREFRDLLLYITPKELADLIIKDQHQVSVYQSGSAYDVSYFKDGVPGRMDIEHCLDWIKQARACGKLLPWRVRARAEGPYAVAASLMNSSLVTCSKPGEMHNPQFRNLVAGLSLENALREAVRATWLVSAKDQHAAKFRWKNAEYVPSSMQETMLDSEAMHESFWYKSFLPVMRKAVDELRQEAKDGKYDKQNSVPVINEDDEFVSLFQNLCFDMELVNEKGPFFVAEGSDIKEGVMIASCKDLPRKGERVCPSKLDGICAGMSQRQLLEYQKQECAENDARVKRRAKHSAAKTGEYDDKGQALCKREAASLSNLMCSKPNSHPSLNFVPCSSVEVPEVANVAAHEEAGRPRKIIKTIPQGE